MAIAIEIVVVALVDAGALPILAFVTAGAVGWLLLRNQCVRPRGRPPVEILKVEPHWPRKLGHMANGLGCSARSGCAQERRLSLNPSLRPKSRPAPQGDAGRDGC